MPNNKAAIIAAIMGIPLLFFHDANADEWYRRFSGMNGMNPCQRSPRSPNDEAELMKLTFARYSAMVRVEIIDGRADRSVEPNQVNVCLHHLGEQLWDADCEKYFRDLAACISYDQRHQH